MDAVEQYNAEQNAGNRLVADTLKGEIERAIPHGQARMYHASPVWFIDGNAVVGYTCSAKGVTLLFWNGREFGEPELVPVGKFHAAQIVYASADRIKIADLQRWLRKSADLIWDYKGMRANLKNK